MVSKKRVAAVLVVLLLIPTYIVVVSAMPMTLTSTCDSGPKAKEAGTTDKVGFCETIGFSVQRSYYFGLLRLPVYRAGMNLDAVNQWFLPALLIAAGLVWKYPRRRRQARSGSKPDTDDEGYSYDG